MLGTPMPRWIEGGRFAAKGNGGEEKGMQGQDRRYRHVRDVRPNRAANFGILYLVLLTYFLHLTHKFTQQAWRAKML